MDTLENATVLAVDNDLPVLLSFKELLLGKCKELLLENNIEEALKLAEEILPDLILLDVTAKKMDGYEICQSLKENKKTQHIPVIFFSSLRRTADKVKCFGIGGAGYIFKHIGKKRASDNEGRSQEMQEDNIVTQIESCLKSRPKGQKSIQNKTQRIEQLSQQYYLKTREIEILRLYLAGYRRKEIASQIYLSEMTVRRHLEEIFQKLGVDSRTALIEKLNTKVVFQ